MADENGFDANELESMGSSEADTGASLDETVNDSPKGVVETGQSKDTRSQPRQSPATDDTSESEYTPREKALIERIERLTGQSYEGQRIQETPVGSQFVPQEHNFLDGLDIDDVLSSSENLNKLLLAVYNQGLQESIRMAGEHFSTTGPSMIQQHVNQHLTMRELVDNFYQENQDLLSVRKTVGAIANEVSQEDPNLTIEQVFAEAAKRTREALGIPAPSNSQRDQRERPNLPSRRQPGNRRNGTNQLSGIAKEIDDLITGVA